MSIGDIAGMGAKSIYEAKSDVVDGELKDSYWVFTPNKDAASYISSLPVSPRDMTDQHYTYGALVFQVLGDANQFLTWQITANTGGAHITFAIKLVKDAGEVSQYACALPQGSNGVDIQVSIGHTNLSAANSYVISGYYGDQLTIEKGVWYLVEFWRDTTGGEAWIKINGAKVSNLTTNTVGPVQASDTERHLFKIDATVGSSSTAFKIALADLKLHTWKSGDPAPFNVAEVENMTDKFLSGINLIRWLPKCDILIDLDFDNILSPYQHFGIESGVGSAPVFDVPPVRYSKSPLTIVGADKNKIVYATIKPPASDTSDNYLSLFYPADTSGMATNQYLYVSLYYFDGTHPQIKFKSYIGSTIGSSVQDNVYFYSGQSDPQNTATIHCQLGSQIKETKSRTADSNVNTKGWRLFVAYLPPVDTSGGWFSFDRDPVSAQRSGYSSTNNYNYHPGYMLTVRGKPSLIAYEAVYDASTLTRITEITNWNDYNNVVPHFFNGTGLQLIDDLRDAFSVRPIILYDGYANRGFSGARNSFSHTSQANIDYSTTAKINLHVLNSLATKPIILRNTMTWRS